MAINFTHVVKSGECLSSILMQHTGFSSAKCGRLAVEAAEASSVDVYSTSEWAEENGIGYEKICDKIFGRGEKRTTCQNLRFIDIKPGQVVSFSMEGGKLWLEIRDADAEPVVKEDPRPEPPPFQLTDGPIVLKVPDKPKQEEPPKDEGGIDFEAHAPDADRVERIEFDRSQWILTHDLDK